MSDSNDPSAWVERAEEDYAVLQSCLRRRKPLTSSACFHAQQCAEKYLKAILVAHNQPFPKTHDLRILSDLCQQAGVILGLDINRIDAISFYAVNTRYPGEDPTVEEARSAREIAKSVRHFVRGLLGS